MKLNQSPQIRKLAQDLGLKPSTDVVSQILGYCDKKIKMFLRDYPDCETLTELLELLSNKLMTTFEIPRSNEDLEQVTQKYLSKGQKYFTRLGDELSDEVYGVTFKLFHREDWESQFVSVIDGRGEKEPRCYFTKWHEIAHLLVLTNQMRLSFRRTHCPSNLKDPEETLMDIIAGHFGFYPKMILPHTKENISFEKIQKLQHDLCPEASNQASLIGFVAAWPKPCLLISAKMGFRSDEMKQKHKQSFEFGSNPQPFLRAVRVSPNDEAKKAGLRIWQNMRIPEKSVIYRVFANNIAADESEEDLSWWESSDGRKLPRLSVQVMAKSYGDVVQALISPLS